MQLENMEGVGNKHLDLCPPTLSSYTSAPMGLSLLDARVWVLLSTWQEANAERRKAASKRNNYQFSS